MINSFCFRLLDFTSLGVRRQLPLNNNVPEKTNGVSEPKKPVEPKKKPQKEDEMLKFLETSTEIAENSNESEDISDHEEITEEQFLNEQNLMLKEQLLQDSSEESIHSEYDSDTPQLNGKQRGVYDSDEFDEDKATSESDESLMEQFLADSEPIEEDEPPKTKEIKLSNESKKRPIPIPSVNAIEKGSDSDASTTDEPPAAKKPKTIIGANIFANIDKEPEIELSSDDNEPDDLSMKPKPKKKAEQSPDSSILLDTSMFKANKKDVDPKKLSKILTTNRNKPTVARVSPAECITVSSDEDSDLEHIPTEKNEVNVNEGEDEEKEKRGKRKLLRDDQLADDTKHAQREEQDRIKRLEKKNERLSQFIDTQKSSQESIADSEQPIDVNEIILDYDTKRKQKIVVHREITKQLKPHQVDGIKFMYDCCYGSVDNIEKYPGSGCILAHCMGLGKTLQMISLLHTVISYPQLKTDRILVICPKSTVMNWKEEIERWVGSIKSSRRLKLFIFPEQS